MLIRTASSADPKSSEITSESVYLSRRELLQSAGALALSAIAASGSAVAAPVPLVSSVVDDVRAPRWLRAQVEARAAGPYRSAGDVLTPYADVSGYNNFYEFGTGKDDPAKNAADFMPWPWKVRIDGEVDKPGDYALEDLLGGVALEERVYRFRCVEAWSMVVPWVGFPLSKLLSRVSPNSRARYVIFETLHDPKRMPGQRSPWLKWPYVEGLQINEAMHPLTIMSVGVYGRTLPAQNGAPLRLVVPWKYGFKSIKSIVRIRLSEKLPRTTWAEMAPDEYGFLANVNPSVDHPRWSQARERRLPTTLFSPNWMETKPFNGYGEHVASLYRGVDLRRSF